MNDNIDLLKKQLKENIELLIDNNKFQEAIKIVDEYLRISPNDADMYSIKSVIFIMQGFLGQAEAILKEGIRKNNDNFDLLYNLGYIYEQNKNYNEAIIIYKVAKRATKDIKLKQLVKEKLIELNEDEKKYRVILYGDYNNAFNLKSELYEWEIIGICSENNLEGSISVHNLNNYDYDFLFVVDEINKTNRISIQHIMDIAKNKNIYFIEDYKVSVIEGLDYKISKLIGQNNINGLVMGLSYGEVGIKAESLLDNFINFSLSSQDLYYDFLLLKKLYMFKQVKDNLKYVVINLAYYSFDYDMTQTISKNRIHRYLDYFKEYHNNNDIINVDIEKYFYEKRITFNDYIEMQNLKQESILNINDPNGQHEAKKNLTMNYINTRNEYENIFDEYIRFLIDNNIKPVVVICPTSKYYRGCYDYRNKKECFYDILNRFRLKYEFQVIDYFDSELFEDNDFWDYSHLNDKGAEKFTQILNKQINW
ncbi:tetratricopeptide repeat protein [Clostridium weizhouense]|uniref:Tetratricopeptide repeat protein n=1 Tax=Clostridium weizhouense TaxID=2859781 RepID=A0ABS7ATT8_9CLOT|nr:tetratricopeptide repeat protein [Clostridium weizhouense]MBW6411568.1 hypothetical protein [Clostridium weizhouense]